jgi:hypothetical protein
MQLGKYWIISENKIFIIGVMHEKSSPQLYLQPVFDEGLK